MIGGREEWGRSREEAEQDGWGRESKMPVGGCRKISGWSWGGRKMMGGRKGVEVQVERPGGRGENRNNG